LRPETGTILLTFVHVVPDEFAPVALDGSVARLERMDPVIGVVNPTSRNNSPDVSPPKSPGEEIIAVEAEGTGTEPSDGARSEESSPSAKKPRVEKVPEVEDAPAAVSLDWGAIQGELLPIPPRPPVARSLSS
jgi:hypothetical protein